MSADMENQEGGFESSQKNRYQIRKQFFGLPGKDGEADEVDDDRDPDAPNGIPGGCHVTDMIQVYKGCNVNYPFFLSLPDIEKFQASSKDIAICGFPKSGSVWLSAIVYMIRSDADPTCLQRGAPLEEKVPYLEFCTPANYAGYRAIDQLTQLPPGRAFFSHLSYEALPPSIPQSKTKIISHIRNPKDVMVSTFFHLKSRRQSRFSGNLEAVVNAFIKDEVCYGPYFDHLASYWKHHQDPNTFHLSFEELSKDFNNVVRRLGKFLNKDLTDDQLNLMAHLCSFDQMKENERTNRINAARAGLLNFEVSPFLRAGSVGNWKLHFSDELNNKVDTWINKNLQRPELKGLHFDFE